MSSRSTPHGLRGTFSVEDLERIWRLNDTPPPASSPFTRILVRRMSPADSRAGVVHVALDGRLIGALGFGQWLNHTIAPGVHRLCVSNGWTARAIVITAEPGSDLTVHCGTGTLRPRRWWPIVRRLLGLRVWVQLGSADYPDEVLPPVRATSRASGEARRGVWFRRR